MANQLGLDDGPLAGLCRPPKWGHHSSLPGLPTGAGLRGVCPGCWGLNAGLGAQHCQGMESV